MIKTNNIVKITIMASFLSWLLGCSGLTFKEKGLEPTSSWELPAQSGMVGISPDGSLIAVSQGKIESRVIDGVKYGGKAKLEIRNLKDGSLVKTLNAFLVNSMAFSQDNSLIAVGNHRGDITIYSLETGQILRTISVPKKDPNYCIRDKHNSRCYTYQIEFSPDSKYLVSITRMQGIDVWDVASGSQLYRLDKKEFEISPDSQFLAFGGSPIELYRLKDGQLVRQLEQSGRIMFSPDGKLMAIYKRRVISFYSLEDYTLQKELVVPKPALRGWEFSPDGKYIALAAQSKTSGGGGMHIGDNRWKPPGKFSAELAIYRLEDLSKKILTIDESDIVLNFGIEKLSFIENNGTFSISRYKGKVYLWDISNF